MARKKGSYRENRYDDYIGIPIEKKVKAAISELARDEERDMTAMARVLLKEAVAARTRKPVAAVA